MSTALFFIFRCVVGSVRGGPLRRVKSVIAIRSLAMRKGMALLMVALLGGCNLAPPHVRPDLPTAADYPPSYAGDATLGQRAVEIGWRDFFKIGRAHV